MESLPFSAYNPYNEEDNYEPMKSKTPTVSVVTHHAKHFLNTADKYEEALSAMERSGMSLLLDLRKIMGPVEIARSIKISRQHLANLTHGRRSIPPRIYVLLARLYAKKLEELKNAN